MSEYTEPKLRKCDQKDCPVTATYTLVWTKQQYYCPIHVQKAIGIASAMGFPTPANTVRLLEPDEMILEADDE